MRNCVSPLLSQPSPWGGGLNWLCTGKFRRLRAASDFARGGKVTKTPPGTAPDEHFVLIVAFPRTPLRGTRTCWILQHFRRAKSEWRSEISTGPLGPGLAKIVAGAVSRLRLGFRANETDSLAAGAPRGSPTQIKDRFWKPVGEGLAPPAVPLSCT